MRSSKGVGVAVSTILIIIVFTVFFATFLYMTNNNIQTRTQLNLESLSLMRLKSTFSLFNQSLGTTWLITTVQSAFIAGEESVGCGYSGDQLVVVEEGYWYQGKNAGRTGTIDSRGNPRTPTEKYNAYGINPQICYPKDEHIVEYMKRVINERGFLKLKELTPDDAGGVSLSIPRLDNKANPSIYIDVKKDDRIESTFSQKITASFDKGMIEKETENNNTIFTQLKNMAAAGRRAVDALLTLGDRINGGPSDTFAYALQKPPDNTAYQNAYRDSLEGTMRLASTSVHDNVRFITTSDLKANGDSLAMLQHSNSGLIFHFVSTVTYSEPPKYYYHDEANNKFEKKPIELTFKVEDYLRALDCVQYQPPAYTGGPVIMNWQQNSDMMCCAGRLFSCGTQIDGLSPANNIAAGTRMTPLGDQESCLNTLSGRSVECTAGGFLIR